MNKWIYKTIQIFFLSIAQISLIPTLVYPFCDINILFVYCAFITILNNLKSGLLASFICGLLMDIFSIHTFGLYTVTLVSTMLIIYLLFEVFFTNKSFYTLAVLSAFGNLLWNIFFIIGNVILAIIANSAYKIVFNRTLFINIFFQTFFTLLLMFIVWKIINMITKRYKLVFITR